MIKTYFLKFHFKINLQKYKWHVPIKYFMDVFINALKYIYIKLTLKINQYPAKYNIYLVQIIQANCKLKILSKDHGM